MDGETMEPIEPMEPMATIQTLDLVRHLDVDGLRLAVCFLWVVIALHHQIVKLDTSVAISNR